MNNTLEIKKDNYGLKMLLMIALLLTVMATMFYQIQQKKPTSQNHVLPIKKAETIYLLKSYATALTYHKNGLAKDKYSQRLGQFDNFITSLGYESRQIQEDEIKSLKKDDILFVIDALSLSKTTKEDIKKFVRDGGNLFFNFTAGFSDENGKYIGEDFVSEITKLKLSPKKKFVTFSEGTFLTQRVFSVLENENSGILLETSLYDQIPIYKTPKEIKPDFLLTTYDQTTPPLAKDKLNNFTLSQAGGAWHGYLGEGKWFYFNLPSYIFYEKAQNVQEYKEIFTSIIDFFSKKIIVRKFPYADVENIVFVSEDTEFRFENFEKFSSLAQKYEIPVTAFIVSSLAQKRENDAMMRKIAQNPYVEFASHSNLHQKIIDTNETYIKQETVGSKIILDRYAAREILGFRPPREELNSLMIKNLSQGGFKYVLGKTQKYIYPRVDKIEKDLLIIPRHGTDDYSYLISLDWDQKNILNQIKKETEFVTALDGIYTLSIHTHLFAYGSNIKIVEDYFKYLKKHPNLTPLDGKTIAKKVQESRDIYLDYSVIDNKITINIENRGKNMIKNFYTRVFKNPTLKISLANDYHPQASIESKDKNSVDVRFRYLEPNKKVTLQMEFKKNL